jgi:RNA-directed DNA polymerase
MPTMADRATQAVVKPGLELAGEAQVAPHRDGFRPGRSPWEAMGASDVQSNQQPTWVLDAAIATGCDRIHHDAW